MNRQKTMLVSCALALMMMGAGGILYSRHSQRLGAPGVKATPLPDGRIAVALPDLPGFVSESKPPEKEELGALPADTSIARKFYQNENFSVLLTVVTMGTDRTSIHRPQFCLTGQGWAIGKDEYLQVAMQKPRPHLLPVRKLTTTKLVRLPDGREVEWKGLYVYWFVAENQVTPVDLERMKSMGKELLTKGLLQRWSYITYFTTCAPGQEDATYAKLTEFMKATVPEFQTVVPW